MFKLNSKDKFFFEENGYLVKSGLENNDNFNILSNKFKIELDKIPLDELKKLGGFNAGNLNIDPGIIGYQIYRIIKDHNFETFFYNIVGETIDNYQIKIGGNLNLPNSSFQYFHTDGAWNPRMFVLNIATSKIDFNNGPMEIYEKSHRNFLPYWKFFFTKFTMKRKQITLNLGEVLFREHRLWHRGTKNKSKKNRELLGIMFLKLENNINDKNQLNIHEEKISIHSNIFQNTFKGKLKEFIFIYIKPIFEVYRIILSFIKNI